VGLPASACDHVQFLFMLGTKMSMTGQGTADTTGKAIAYLLVGVTGGLGLDLCAKALLASYPLEQFVFLRSAIGLAVFLALLPRFGGTKMLRTRRWAWHLLRTMLASGAMFGFFYALARMPLVDALTLGFTAPLMVTALSALLPGDTVGWRRWTAVLAGFAGVLVMLRPGAGEISVAAAACLFAAFCYACLAVTARKLAATESSIALSVYVIAGPMLISVSLLGGGGWVAPDAGGWLLFVVAGMCSVIAWLGIIGAYRRAPPAMLAPFEYTALVGGAVAGYLIWDEVPDSWTLIGAAIIVASSIFVVYREVGVTLRRRERDRPAPPVLPAVPPRPR
jgi:drug/metabolite transporter (DMT)-like permease